MRSEKESPSIAATTEGQENRTTIVMIAGDAQDVNGPTNETGDAVEAYRTSGQSPGNLSFVAVNLADVQTEEVEWLWAGRVPFGKITVLDGDPGLGKSTLTLDLAARLSVGGEMPNEGEIDPSDVLILSAEDGIGDTIRPRLEAAGADMARIHAITAAVSNDRVESFPSIDAHVQNIGDAVRSYGARLVIIDPFVAYLGSRLKAERDQDVRRALAPLAAMAGDTCAAIVLVRHLRKGGRELGAILSGGGSIGIAGAARSVLLLAKDPHDEDRRVLASVKSNLSQRPASLALRIVSDEQGRPKIAWEGSVATSANELLATIIANSGGRNAIEAAQEFLHDLLSGGPRPANEVYSVGKEAGHSYPTLRRAMEPAGVKATKVGSQWLWSWSSPEGDQGSGKMIIPTDEHLEHLPSETPLDGTQGRGR